MAKAHRTLRERGSELADALEALEPSRVNDGGEVRVVDKRVDQALAAYRQAELDLASAERALRCSLCGSPCAPAVDNYGEPYLGCTRCVLRDPRAGGGCGA